MHLQIFTNIIVKLLIILKLVYKLLLLMPKILNKILGQETLNKINNSNLLIVGVGGIGCEIIKNLSKSGFKNFTLFDFDHIQFTNLNRQFYFRKQHIGKTKAEIGKLSIQKIDPSLKIVSICDDIFSTIYNRQFFQRFDIIISALDNVKARQYLSSVCTNYSIPFVDAGTGGYSSYTKSVVRFLSQCHNCKPSKQQQSFAVCTIRNTPTRPVHCVHFAKSFYDCFFGGSKDNDLKGDITFQQFFENDNNQSINRMAIKVFNVLFHQRIIQKIKTSSEQVAVKIHSLSFQEAIKMQNIVQNPKTTFNQKQHRLQIQSLYQEEKLWTIKKYAERFIESFIKITKTKLSNTRKLQFQKDDQDCMMLVFCISNLRTYNFMDKNSLENKHKFLTYYQTKQVAGKIIPAIASTNSIAAGTQILETIKLLKHDYANLFYISYNNNNFEKLHGTEQAQPNLNCSKCTIRNISLSIGLDFSIKTIGDLQDFLKKYFSLGRVLYAFNQQGQIRKISQNISNKYLSQLGNIIIQHKFINFIIKAEKDISEFEISIYAKHDPKTKQIIINSKYSRQDFVRLVIKYYRTKFEQKVQQKNSQLNKFGYK